MTPLFVAPFLCSLPFLDTPDDRASSSTWLGRIARGGGIHAEDLDGDGDLDFLVASEAGDRVVRFENLGSGAFVPRVVITPAAVGGLVVPAGPSVSLGLAPKVHSTLASTEKLGMTTFLDAEGGDPDGTIVLWEWDFEGDGVYDHASSVGPGAFHTYASQGSYRARLRATDDSGLKSLAHVDVTVEPPSAETVTDADGNVYQTVVIGEQTWMLENLKTTTLNDGTPIVEQAFGTTWNTGFAKYSWADTSDVMGAYDPELPVDFYGIAYNEAALASGQLAPVGWRIPSEQDWLELEAFLTSDGFAGAEPTALKTTFGWAPSSGDGVDAYGFRGLPGGYVNSFGGATGAPAIASWATSENPTPSTRLVFNLLGNSAAGFGSNSVWLGATVRCIKE